MRYGDAFRNTPQSEPLPGREAEMVHNPAGGYTFALGDWERLRRFLVLGTEGGTYYEAERAFTLQGAACVSRCIAEDGPRVVREIVEVSGGGLAPKNDPAVFALALASAKGDGPTRRAAHAALPRVCRIGTHLFQFAEAREAVGGGWGRGCRNAVRHWYQDRELPDLVLQALKYQRREGWAHRDLLRLGHPHAGGDAARAAVYDAICRPDRWDAVDDPRARGWAEIQRAESAGRAAEIVAEHRLPRELVPTAFLTDARVWAALLPGMPLGALVRNLGNMTRCGLLKPMSDAAGTVAARLADGEAIRRARLHPFSVLLAARTYAGGHGVRGGGEWVPVGEVVAALDRAFDLAHAAVEPTGLRHLLAVDVSGSMESEVAGSPISAAEAAAATALTTARVEPWCQVMGFATAFRDLGVTGRDSLVDVLRKTTRQNFGGTDAAVPIRWAQDKGVGVDLFVVLSDGETWAGDAHPARALDEYRKQTGIAAKLACVNFTATGRTIADPADRGSMNFVALDASLPQALRAFATEGGA